MDTVNTKQHNFLNTIKQILVGVIILAGFYLFSREGKYIYLIILSFGFSIPGLVQRKIRKQIRFMHYFKHPLNLFTSSRVYQLHFDLSPDLLAPKILEAIKKSEFTITDGNEGEKLFLATTPHASYFSAENVYIQCTGSGNRSTLIMYSVAPFSNVVFNNEHNNNFKHFKSKLSLTMIV